MEKDWQVNRGGFGGKRRVILGHNLIGEVVGFSDQVTSDVSLDGGEGL